ncbi:glycoside hydrolase family 9 protein [Anaerosporobacter sp.]
MGNKKLKKTMSMILGVSLILGTVGNAVPAVLASSDTNTVVNTKNYNYGDALEKSVMFYDFQKSGKLPENQRNNWRGDSGLADGADVGLDLTGGMYDCGDHVKFNLPMAYTSTMLAWSYLESTDIYKNSGQDVYLLENIKWITDYLIKCHPSADVYYYQVGDGGLDHAYWTSAEVMQMNRPAYKVDLDHPGSAVCGEAAAALASASILFKDSDPTYAATCLKHAKELFSLAERMKGDSGYKEHAGSYYNSSHFYDELSWASIWIYIATNDGTYLTKSKDYSEYWGKEGQTDEIAYTWAHCWDDVHFGAELLIAQHDSSEDAAIYKEAIENNLDYWTTGKDGERITYTPKGLAFRDSWGSLRYSSTQSFLASVYADWDKADPGRADTYETFAKSQADYILGSSGRSYLIGYDETSPTQPHHRTAHGAWENNASGAPSKARHVLVGALVGGPDSNDGYQDVITDYQHNEVGCDYNAGLVGLMAKMYDDFGGTINPDLNAIETVGEELFVEAGVNAQDKQNTVNFVELKTVVYNRTAWPARVTDKLSFRYFVDISDVIASGKTASDMKIACSYSQRSAKVSELKPWDAEHGIYYTEIDLSGAKIYPGGQSEHKNELQIRITAPGKWDYTKSPSFKDLENSSSSSLVKSENIALYDDGKLVFGKEPSKGSDIPVETPTVEVVNPTDGAVIDMSKEVIPIELNADASIAKGNITKVVFYVNDKEVGTSISKPYQASFTPSGTASKLGDLKSYTIKAKAYGDNGTSTVSKSITVQVQLPVSEKPIPTDIEIEVSNTGNTAISTSTLQNNFSIKHKSGKALDLSKLSIRYYYTSDGTEKETVWCDNTSMTYNKAPWYVSYTGISKGNVVKMSDKTSLSDSYIEITFNSSDTLEEGAVLNVATRTAKDNWSNYDQSNDYSYGDSEKVAVYYDGILISGIEP